MHSALGKNHLPTPQLEEPETHALHLVLGRLRHRREGGAATRRRRSEVREGGDRQGFARRPRQERRTSRRRGLQALQDYQLVKICTEDPQGGCEDVEGVPAEQEGVAGLRGGSAVLRYGRGVYGHRLLRAAGGRF